MKQYECLENIEVSDQYGDDTKIEKGSKWKFDNYDANNKFNLMVDDDGKVIKITDYEFVRYFKEVV